MALTPQDVQSQQFHVRFRGFDVDEVDDFLEKVSEDYLTAIQENKRLKERLEELQNDLVTYRDQEKSFQKAFVSAQQMADEMTEKSKKEAAEIVEQAQQEAQRLHQAANQEIAGLEKQLDLLKAQKNEIREELRTTLTGYLGRLDEIFEAAPAPATESRYTEEPTDPPLEDDVAEDLADEEEVEYEAGSIEIEGSSYEEDAGATEKDQNEDTFFQGLADAESDEDDDLYEKVDLTDDFRLPEEDELPDGGEGKKSIFSMGEKQEQALPDIEGEMVFSLDDPLDDLAPDNQIREEEPAKE